MIHQESVSWLTDNRVPYVLNSSGFESSQVSQGFLSLKKYRPFLGLALPSVQWPPGVPDVMLTIQHLAFKLRISGTVHLLSCVPSRRGQGQL
jgi:hypothetical protein